MPQHDSNDDIGTKKDLVLYRLETARGNLRAAKVLYEMKEFKDALGNFNKEYVKTSLFPDGINRRIMKAEMIRHASDYDDFYIAKISDVEEIIATAEELLQLCEAFCQKQLKNSLEE